MFGKNQLSFTHANITLDNLEKSMQRRKRDLKDDYNTLLSKANDHMGGTFGIGDTCGMGAGVFAAKSHDQCNAITECKCGSSSVVCKCTLTWWFILIIVLASIIIIGLITFCIVKACGCCKQ